MGWYYGTSFLIVLASMVNGQDLLDPSVLMSTAPQGCEEGYTCVKYYLCVNEGKGILTNGSGLLTPREEGPVSTTTPAPAPASCNGDPLSKCCKNPEKQKTMHRLGACNLNEFCVPYYLCDGQKGIVKDGRRLLDARSDESPCESYLDVCCANEPTKMPVDERKSPNEGCGWRNKDGLYFESLDSQPNQAKFTEFPWTVAILDETMMDKAITDVYKCGGSLIHPSVVLTAAHCIGDVSGSLKVRAGEWDTQTFREPLPQQDLKVKETIIHPNYDVDTLQYDIAILIATGAFELKDNVQPICLPPVSTVFDGQSCYVTGWGKTEFGRQDTYQVIMKKLGLPTIPRTQCQNMFRKTRLGPFYELHSSVMCAGGEEGVDACIGDGGSPLVCPIPGTDERYYQAGIVSWGIDCGDKDVPGAYVAVSEMRPWIEKELSDRKIDFKYFTQN